MPAAKEVFEKNRKLSGLTRSITGGKPGWFLGLLLVACTVLAYVPTIRGGFIWDDDSWTSNISGPLRDLSGLQSLWINPTTLQQYYPLTGTSFWLDYQLWGFRPLPYHLENVLLHCCAALLFVNLLRRLEVPGAWLAGAIFALHPLMVESAGWITERKNVLSFVLYLGSLLAYGRFSGFWKEGDGDVPDSSMTNSTLSGNQAIGESWSGIAGGTGGGGGGRFGWRSLQNVWNSSPCRLHICRQQRHRGEWRWSWRRCKSRKSVFRILSCR